MIQKFHDIATNKNKINYVWFFIQTKIYAMKFVALFFKSRSILICANFSVLESSMNFFNKSRFFFEIDIEEKLENTMFNKNPTF